MRRVISIVKKSKLVLPSVITLFNCSSKVGIIVVGIWLVPPNRIIFFFNTSACICLSMSPFPLDLARHRIQIEVAGGQASIYDTTFFGTFGHIIQTKGIDAFFLSTIQFYKVVPGVGIVL